MRIGHGYDIHPLAFGRPLVLGGIEIPGAKGAKGYSDADCLTHAVIDSVLGAAGLGDIGHHFPDTDERYRDARSVELLEKVGEKIRSIGFEVVNIDATINLQVPKLNTFKTQIAQGVAQALRIQPFQVNVKAKSGEGIGPIGQQEAIEARSVCLLEETDQA